MQTTSKKPHSEKQPAVHCSYSGEGLLWTQLQPPSGLVVLRGQPSVYTVNFLMDSRRRSLWPWMVPIGNPREDTLAEPEIG